MVNAKTIPLSLLLAGFVFLGGDAIASNHTIGAGEQNARVRSAVFTADPAPTLHVRVVGEACELAEGEESDDLFPYNTQVTQVLVTIEPPSGETIEVTATSGPSWSENVTSGSWEATFAMPAAGGTTLGEFDIVVDPDGEALTGTGKFKVKKSTGGSTGGG
jgi:hypothetical protein